MVPTGLDQLWVADITYVRLQEEFTYLAIVLDAFSRRVVGWALDTHLQASLATAALAMVLVSRKPAPGTLIHHSDRGVQYACNDYTDLLARTKTWLSEVATRQRRVVAFTHPGVVRACILLALDAPPISFWRLDIPPSSATTLHFRGGSWTVRGTARPL